MHNQGGNGASSSMDHNNHLAHHDQNYGNEQWSDMGPYMQTTMSEYTHSYGFMPSITHRLPLESLGQMPPPATPPPPPLHSQHQGPPPPSHHPTLPMLMVPSHPTWPSMLTNPSGFNSSPPVAICAASAGIHTLDPPRQPAPPIASQPRKTLTDDDRRRMCEWHIQNPDMKQTEIGARFGVERSTVSKVLSRKDKWLNQEERSNSPIKKTKGKVPDIDKTLANWLRNEQHRGRQVSDSEIQEQARMYARPFREAETKISNPSWLEKFKHKHGMGSRLTRRASETNISSAASSKLPIMSPTLASSQTSSVSPVHRPSISPFQGLRAGGDDEKQNGNSPMTMDFNEPPSIGTGNHFKSNVFSSDTTSSSFSDNTVSPTGTAQFTFSPDPNVDGFLSSDHARHIPPGGPNFQRPRSQTFPTLDLEYMNQSSEPMTPRVPSSGHPNSTAPSSALDSPAPEYAQAGPFGLDPTLSSHQQPVSSHQLLHHSSSASSLQGRMQQQQHQQSGSNTTPVISSVPMSSIASSPGSPSQEDARRAADTLLSFIANSGPNSLVDQSDYNAVIRLTEKLRLHQQAQAAAVRGQQIMGMGPSVMSGMGMGISMGGLDRIPEGDAEMGNTGQLGEVQGSMIKAENDGDLMIARRRMLPSLAS